MSAEDSMIRRARLAEWDRDHAPCDIRQGQASQYAHCETHDETFPLGIGAVCSMYRAEAAGQAMTARARGDWQAEHAALDIMARDDIARMRP